MERIVIDARCPLCNSPVQIEGAGLFSVARAVCPHCGAVVIARIIITLQAERISDKMMEKFVSWLTTRKGLMNDTAKRYAQMVERYYKEGKYPPTVSPLEYWQEFKETVLSKNTEDRVD